MSLAGRIAYPSHTTLKFQMNAQLFLFEPSPPRYGEDPRAFLRAAAERNGLPYWRVARSLGIRSKHDAALASRLAELGVNQAMINDGYKGAPGRPLRTVCSECLKQGRPTLGVFQTRPMTYCPLHRIRLIDACQTCESRLTWRSDLFDVCDSCSNHICAHHSTRHAERSDAETLHHAVFCNVDPNCRIDATAAESILADSRLTEQAIGRLKVVYRMAWHGGRGAQRTRHFDRDFSLMHSWQDAIGDSIQTLVRRVSVPAAQAVWKKRPQALKKFPTGFDYLDTLLAAELPKLERFGMSELERFCDADRLVL